METGFKEVLMQGAHDIGVALTRDELGKDEEFFAELVDWNRRMNLTSIIEPQEAAIKHFVDSLSAFLFSVWQKGARVIDIGSGAGFPGLVLKIHQPDLYITLLDSLNKRIRFLTSVVTMLNLTNVEAIHGRAEEAGRQRGRRESFDIAIARAVADLSILAEYALPFVALGGVFVAMKGPDVDQEIDGAHAAVNLLGGKIEEIQTVHLPLDAGTRRLVLVRKVAPTPDTYPRKPGIPTKRPILSV